MSTDYSLMDATLEILLMLLGAFLLGWLFCWLMKKLFGRKPTAIKQQASFNRSEPTIGGANASLDIDADLPRARMGDVDLDIDTPNIKRPQINLNEVDLPKGTRVKAPKIDIETPDVDINTPDINVPRPRIDLPDFNTPDVDVKGKLDAGISAGKTGLGKGLGAATAGIGAIAVGASSFKDKAVDKLSVDVNAPDVDINTPDVSLPDANLDLPDLDKPNFDAEIDLPDVATPDFDTEIDLPEIPDINAPSINTDGVGLDVDTPSASLPDVDLSGAKSAISGTVEAGKSKLGAGIGAATAGVGALAAGAVSLKDSAVDKVAGLDDKLTRPDLPNSTSQVDDGRVQAQAGADDLSRISGINEQVIGVLNNRGIHSYQDLQGTNRTQLKEYLDASGDSKLSALEPASWPHQATLCGNRNWTKLSEYQSFLAGSNLDTRQAVPAYDVGDGDDLKKVEGIGPFFESLLNDAGITTYEQLKNSERDTLKEIIDAAGPDYRMHEPETWPYQAGLAYRGEWKKLQDYIHFMTGRN